MDHTQDQPEVENDTLTAESHNFEQIPHWLLFHPDVTSNAIRLYLVLRSYAMGRGTAFPSRRTLAEAMHTSMPTMDAAKRCLISVGAITVKSRQHDNGHKATNLYRVRWQEPEGGSKESCTRGSKESFPGWQRNLPIEAYVLEADILEADKRLVQKPISTGSEAGFDRFWSIYPRREGKAAARLAWSKATRKQDPEVIIAGAVRYRDDPNREAPYTAHASTWLNGERWEDDPLPERSTRSDRKVSEVQSMIERAQARDANREVRSLEA